LVAAGSLALAACGEKIPSDARTEAPLVRTVLVQPAASSARSFTGVVAARVQSDLGFRVPGKVLERLVDAGQTVKRGQALMRIDPIDLKLAASAQQETVAAARARALQAAQDEARYRELQGTGAISASAYDTVKAAADAANAQLSAAEAQADVARNASRYSELVADGDGVIIETLAEPGQVVGAGQTVVRLAHGGRREAVVQLPETLRPAIGSPAQATLFGKEAETPAKLRQLSDAADRLTRTFEARYVLADELAGAPLGSTVTVRIPTAPDSPQDRLQVPISAIFDAGKGPGVWLIGGEPAKVSWRSVAIRQLGDDRAQVTGQLKPGDQVVALGAHLLSEGARVRVGVKTAAARAQGARP
jgi:RND family efflux transporter MFP subunit